MKSDQSKTLLIANRGEIALRIMEAAAALGMRTVAIYSEDDANSLHVMRADEARQLRGVGPAAYLDAGQIVEIAREAGCAAIHPGYGFLSENAAFARRCREAGLIFIGPPPELLDLFGDKVQARELARKCEVPVLAGTAGATTLVDAAAFFKAQEPHPVVIKAIAGGGGRGMRVVRRLEDLEEAYTRCQSEARAAFGNGEVYLERLMPEARHVEVQILGDQTGNVTHLWERECTVQRRHQKLIEIAPAPGISKSMRTRLIDAALTIARSVRYEILGTFEFLVTKNEEEFAFIEANPRLQVEHPVTEAVTGVDLVRAQIDLAFGRSLEDIGLGAHQPAEPRGYAIELRINAESMGVDGSARPSSGTITVFEPPSGPGIRVDSFAYAGYAINPRFDSLIGKLIAHSPTPDFPDAVGKASRALNRLRIEGVATNRTFLQAVLAHPDFVENRIHTGFVEEKIAELATAAKEPPKRRNLEGQASASTVGAKIDPNDPLAVLHHGKSRDGAGSGFDGSPAFDASTPDGSIAVRAPMQGTIISVDIKEEDSVSVGQQLVVIEAMKMEHVIAAPVAGIVRQIAVAAGDTVPEGCALIFMEQAETGSAVIARAAAVDLEYVRPDLAEVIERHELTLDAARPESVERRRKTGQRTARENLEELCDPDSFVEYGALAIAAQRRRRTVEDLIKNTPADGFISGHATINGDKFGPVRAHCVVMAYDFTVLAGTQGHLNHRKTDRMIEFAREFRLPVVLFAEGGGGRPGDTDGHFNTRTFYDFPRLSALVPLVGIVSGRCYAGNASMLGCCDVVIATRNSNIGMGGPAMIESGGLGIFRPEQIGPVEVQVPSGVIDILVNDEIEAARVARKYLSYFQGSLAEFECADQRLLRSIIPENRLRGYDVRKVIATMADNESVLELRPHFGRTTITALARIEGRAVGIVANNPMHLAGAIDSEGADKAARFIVLCDAFDIPLVYLCDTPGIMVGPEIEKTALVRHSSRMFLAGANAQVPFLTIVLRKAYGLGANAMQGGAPDAPDAMVSWPTGEFGPMALEGAAKLGYRKELAAIADPVERKKVFDEMVAKMYRGGKALNNAMHFFLDDVIDPADSRRWITATLRSTPAPVPREKKKYPFIDSW